MSEGVLRNLRLVTPTEIEAAPRPRLLVHAVRTALLIGILGALVTYQIRLGNFLNVEIWMPVYAVLLLSFALNSAYLFLFDKLGHRDELGGALFALDTVAVTLLIYFTGTGQSLFLFLYLVNLILGGLAFGKEGGWRLTAWTSACFSALLILSPDVAGQSLYFSLFVNNLAFVAVTTLSGRLNDQLLVAGARLRETRSDLEMVQNLNDSIVGNIRAGIVLLGRGHFVRYFNGAATTLLEAGDFGQRKIQDVMPELEWPWTSLTEDESLDAEVREVRRGSRVFEVTVTRFRDGESKLKGWLLVIDDRTERKHMEERLRQQDKLAAVGQLAAGIAHEIRNPLASISGSVQLMLGSDTKRPEDETRLMRIIDKEIDRLNGLITEFLEYVRPEAAVEVSGEPVDLNALIRETLEATQFNHSLRRDVERETNLRPGATIIGHRDKLKQALLNFVINAYQALEKTERPHLGIETVVGRDTVTLIVRDNGCGIKAENLGRIFEPFHTTKAKGTGLGLAVTHKILEAHRAVVAVTSEVGVGTRFQIDFPGFRDFHTEDLIPRKARAGG
jgi:two-component system sensor histidine kinase PilS (NtrC family)